jgi:hypothetical protein
MSYAGIALGSLLILAPVSTVAQPAMTRPIEMTAQRIDLNEAPAIRFEPDAIDLHRVSAIVPRADGSVIVANDGSLQLLLFDRTGTFVRTVGGKGAGPGEYVELWSVDRLPGDSIVVLDRYQRRVTILAPDGTYVRSFNIAPPFEGGGTPTRLVALRSGDLLIGYSEVRTMAPSPVAQQFRERLFVYLSSGTVRTGTGISLLGSEHFTQATPMRQGGVAYWSRSFGRVLTVRAVDDGFAAGDGTEWSVDVHRRSGAVPTRHRIARDVARVTPSAIAAERDATLSKASSDRLELFRRMYDEMPYPETMPAYARFEVDERERIWIEEYSSPAARPRRAVWVRVDPQARQAVAVRFPYRFQPMAFARGHVFGIWRDADDVEYVRAYNLGRLP